jgi:hypothetical protein
LPCSGRPCRNSCGFFHVCSRAGRYCSSEVRFRGGQLWVIGRMFTPGIRTLKAVIEIIPNPLQAGDRSVRVDCSLAAGGGWIQTLGPGSQGPVVSRRSQTVTTAPQRADAKFAVDSPVEGNGFELSVPQCASASDSAAVVTKPNLPVKVLPGGIVIADQLDELARNDKRAAARARICARSRSRRELSDSTGSAIPKKSRPVRCSPAKQISTPRNELSKAG